MTDEPLLSPPRIWYAFIFWALWNREACVPLGRLLRFHRRPHAAHHHDYLTTS